MQNIAQRILYEDNHLIVINKLCSEIVQGDKTGDISLLEMVKAYIKEQYQKPGNVFLGLVHRIDRPVSGVIIFAKTSKALTRMNEAVKNRQFTKIYWAITEQMPPLQEDNCVDYMQKNESLNKSFVSRVEKAGWKRAELQYKVIGHSERYTKVEIILLTGRHHQIRAQMASRGAILKGDLKYGAKRANGDGSICLHAREVTFEHPVTREMITIEAPINNELFAKIWNS
jgi:23S rRNA pseudouridine1911/1915/1917 synthase